jgi:polyisoprenoid-binding protein YceI
MPTVDEKQGAEARVFTFKEGLLSAVAHDLEIAVERLRIEWTDRQVTATFDLRSLRVLHAVVAGRPAPGALSAHDLRKIEQTIAADVLRTESHPEARFQTSSVTPSGSGFELRGTLTLVGHSEESSATIRREGTRYTTELVLDQRRFGITPYSAMLGTLKLKPDVRVHVSVPA